MITSHATGLAKGAVYAPPVPVKIVGSVKPIRQHPRTAGPVEVEGYSKEEAVRTEGGRAA